MLEETVGVSDSSKNIPNTPLHAHIKAEKGEDRFKTRLDRFFQQITGIFAKENAIDHEHHLLVGRIHELQNSGQEVLDALLKLKKTIENDHDPILVSAASAHIDTIIREIKSLNGSLAGKHKPAEQVKLYNRYTDCIEKGKTWLSNLAKDSIEIHKFVMVQTVQEFHMRIDRDLQVIQDYLNHSLVRPEINHVNKQELSGKMSENIAHLLENLKGLKGSCVQENLEAFFRWRSEVDKSREEWFSSALHIVDEQINSLIKEHPQ